MDSKTKREQRIKMRMYKHPVKHDGTITEFARGGRSFVVVFDGPLGMVQFWRWGETLVTDKEPLLITGSSAKQLAPDAELWEVL